MSKKYIWIFTLALVAVFILAACERSAVAPESTPVGDSGGLTTGSTPTSTRYWDPTTTPTTSGLLPTLTGTVVVIVPTPTIGVPDSYKLQKGEYPYCIARRFNVDIGELLSLNGLRETDLFEEGLVLKIPKTGNSFIGSRTLIHHPTTYSAVMGDTVYRIACAFGDVDPIYLAAYNGLVAPYTLTTGTLLNIP
jgi:LysM repeat protein